MGWAFSFLVIYQAFKLHQICLYTRIVPAIDSPSKGLSVQAHMSLPAPQALRFPWHKVTASGFSLSARMKASRPGRGSIEVLLLWGWLVFPGSCCCCRGLINDTDRGRVIHSARGGEGGNEGVWKEAGRERNVKGKGEILHTIRAKILIILLFAKNKYISLLFKLYYFVWNSFITTFQERRTCVDFKHCIKIKERAEQQRLSGRERHTTYKLGCKIKTF